MAMGVNQGDNFTGGFLIAMLGGLVGGIFAPCWYLDCQTLAKNFLLENNSTSGVRQTSQTPLRAATELKKLVKV